MHTGSLLWSSAPSLSPSRAFTWWPTCQQQLCFCSRTVFLSLDLAPENSLIHLWTGIFCWLWNVTFFPALWGFKFSTLKGFLEHSSSNNNKNKQYFWTWTHFSSLPWFPKHLILWLLISATGTLHQAVQARPPCSFPTLLPLQIHTAEDPSSSTPLTLSHTSFSLCPLLLPTLATCLDSQAGIEILLERFPVVPWN